MPEHSTKLFYFPMRGRAETARLLLVYSGTKYEDVRISVEQWPAMKESKFTFAFTIRPLIEFSPFPEMPMGQMPVLEVDGKQLCQSTAIARYLARENGKPFTFSFIVDFAITKNSRIGRKE